MIPLFLLSSFSFTAKRSELVGFVAAGLGSAIVFLSSYNRDVYTQRDGKEKRGAEASLGDNFTRGANRRSRRSRSHRRGRPVQTRSVNTQSASVRAPGGGRHSLMRARRLRVTQRALFGRNCQRTARPGGCRATSALPRHLLGFLLLALCSRTLLSRLALVSLFSIIQKSRLDFFAFG